MIPNIPPRRRASASQIEAYTNWLREKEQAEQKKDDGSVTVERGPGTELKALLKNIGITASPDCSCNARARKMDEMEKAEPGWCAANIDTIVGWLREEATKRGLPFFGIAAKLLVKRAISNARRKEATRAKEA